MGLPYRKLVRAAIVSCLSLGYNDGLTQIEELYGVQTSAIDFSDGSTNFLQAYVDPDQIELAPFTEYPAMCCYTEDAAESDQPYALGWGGAVIGCVDIFFRYRDGIEGSDIESPLDAAEDAVMTVFRAYKWPIVKDVSTVIYSRRAKSQRRHFIPLSDGWCSRVSIQAQFGVSIN